MGHGIGFLIFLQISQFGTTFLTIYAISDVLFDVLLFPFLMSLLICSYFEHLRVQITCVFLQFDSLIPVMLRLSVDIKLPRY